MPPVEPNLCLLALSRRHLLALLQSATLGGREAKITHPSLLVVFGEFLADGPNAIRQHLTP